MKQINLLSIVLLLSFHSFSQLPNWVWAKQARGTQNGGETCSSVVTDVSGNVYITGTFQDSTITFGSNIFTNHSYLPDSYIVKYNSSGAILWAHSFGGSRQDIANSLTTDLAGNIYVTGSFDSRTLFFGTDSLINSGNFPTSDIFIAKYSSSGTLLWAKSAGGARGDVSYSLSIDNSNNLYVTGYFWSPTIVFGTDTLTNSDPSGGADMFLAKYSSAGTVVWAKRADGNNAANLTFLSTDVNGNIYITGDFNDSSIVFGTTTLTNTGNNIDSMDIFIVKYSPTGTVLWAKSVGTVNNEFVHSISTDVSGNVYLAGSFDGPIIVFGADTLRNTSGIEGNMFVVKYSTTGSVLLVKTAIAINSSIGSNQNIAYSIKTDNLSNVYVAGSFLFQTLVFGTDTLLFPTGGSDALFIIKFDSTLNVICSSALTSGGNSNTNVTSDNFGNAYVTGVFQGISFIVGVDSLVEVGNPNVFVAKFNCSGTSGINELQNKENILIYPNPTTSLTTITFSTEQTNTTIKITDILGQGIRNYELGIRNGKTVTLDMNGYAKGIYFVQITDANKNVVNKKVVVQ